MLSNPSPPQDKTGGNFEKKKTNKNIFENSFGLTVKSIREGEVALQTNRQMTITKKLKQLRNRLDESSFPLSKINLFVTMALLTAQCYHRKETT